MPFFKWELVILQLNRFRDVPYEKLDMPYGMTQDGIATALCISRAHASVELKKIQNKGYVDILPAHVMYRPKTLNVYSLTSNGRRKAMELLDRAKEESIDVDSSDWSLRTSCVRSSVRTTGSSCRHPPPSEPCSWWPRISSAGSSSRPRFCRSV